MFEFITGGLYTIIILSLGVFIGILASSGKLEQKVERAVRKIHQQRHLESGPVKSMTQEEKQEADRKPISSRIKELIS